MNKKDRRVQSIEIIATMLVEDRDVEMVMWYIDRADRLSRILNCECTRPKVGTLTCIECDND